MNYLLVTKITLLSFHQSAHARYGQNHQFCCKPPATRNNLEITCNNPKSGSCRKPRPPSTWARSSWTHCMQKKVSLKAASLMSALRSKVRDACNVDVFGSVWSEKKKDFFSLFFFISFPRTRETSWRDRLPTGQKNFVLHLPGLQEALWFHTAQYTRQDHRGKKEVILLIWKLALVKIQRYTLGCLEIKEWWFDKPITLKADKSDFFLPV